MKINIKMNRVESGMYFLSIIVPIYNIDRKYFEKCINSLLNQTFRNIEIILVNDGSTNGIEKECYEYDKKNDRVRFIDKQNEGVSSARNVGIKVSTGKYIMFIDSDDWIEEITCECIYNSLSKSNSDILIFESFRNYLNKQECKSYGQKEEIIFKNEAKKSIEINLIDLRKTFVYDNEIYKISSTVWGKCFKRQIIIDNNIFFNENLKCSEDSLFILYALQYTKDIFYLKKSLYHYRIRKSSVCLKFDESVEDSIMNEIICFQNFILESKRNDKFTEAFYGRVFNSYKGVLMKKYFNLENTNSYYRRKKQWENFINNKMLLYSFNNIDRKTLDIKDRIILFLTLYKCFFSLKIIYKLYFIKTNKYDIPND